MQTAIVSLAPVNFVLVTIYIVNSTLIFFLPTTWEKNEQVLMSKLHCGTSKTMQLVPVHLDLLTSLCDFVPCDHIVQRNYLVQI